MGLKEAVVIVTTISLLSMFVVFSWAGTDDFEENNNHILESYEAVCNTSGQKCSPVDDTWECTSLNYLMLKVSMFDVRTLIILFTFLSVLTVLSVKVLIDYIKSEKEREGRRYDIEAGMMGRARRFEHNEIVFFLVN